MPSACDVTTSLQLDVSQEMVGDGQSAQDGLPNIKEIEKKKKNVTRNCLSILSYQMTGR